MFIIKRLKFEFKNPSSLNIKDKFILLMNFKNALNIIEENRNECFLKKAKEWKKNKNTMKNKNIFRK